MVVSAAPLPSGVSGLCSKGILPERGYCRAVGAANPVEYCAANVMGIRTTDIKTIVSRDRIELDHALGGRIAVAGLAGVACVKYRKHLALCQVRIPGRAEGVAMAESTRDGRADACLPQPTFGARVALPADASMVVNPAECGCGECQSEE
jgi:hypothetical protein